MQYHTALLLLKCWQAAARCSLLRSELIMPAWLSQVFNGVSHQFVKFMATLDCKLEGLGWLSHLDEQKLPDEVLKDSGEPIAEYQEVCVLCVC